MAYTVRAYRRGTTLKIPIEEKHKYYNVNNRQIQTKTQVYQSVITANDVKEIHCTNSFQIGTGTGEDSIIGKKIQIKDITYTCIFRLVASTYTDYIPHSDSFDLWTNCRLMIVKFDDPHTENQIATWFENNYIYYGTSGQTPTQSTWMSRLRESTNDTGKFTILKDIKFRLDKKNSVKEITLSLSPKKDCTISSNGGYITNGDMENIYCFLIGPISYSWDVDARTSEMSAVASWDSNGAGKPLIVFDANIKYTMYDLN